MSLVIDQRNFRAARKFVQSTMKAVQVAETRTVNRVAQKTRTEASKQIRAEVQLKASYVNENLKVSRKAKPGKSLAVISARRRPTRLYRYGGRQLTVSARRAKGDSLRGISSGRKQAGVSVAVSRSGGRRRMRKAFVLPLNTNGLMGAFIRTGPGKKDIEHLYGPSVDQTFETIRTDLRPFVRREMVKEYKAQLNYAMGQEVRG